MRRLTFNESSDVMQVLGNMKLHRFFNKQDKGTKYELYQLMLEDEGEFKSKVLEMYREKYPNKADAVEEQQIKVSEAMETQDKYTKEKLTSFFKTQGINKPSDTTLNAFERQDIMANFNKFYNFVGKLTLNQEKQAQFNFYDVQQRQSFITIAQNDEIIKQNDKIVEQNEKLIEQNEMMIELMKQMASK